MKRWILLQLYSSDEYSIVFVALLKVIFLFKYFIINNIHRNSERSEGIYMLLVNSLLHASILLAFQFAKTLFLWRF